MVLELRQQLPGTAHPARAWASGAKDIFVDPKTCFGFVSAIMLFGLISVSTGARQAISLVTICTYMSKRPEGWWAEHKFWSQAGHVNSVLYLLIGKWL